jgi:hypothetical protein
VEVYDLSGRLIGEICRGVLTSLSGEAYQIQAKRANPASAVYLNECVSDAHGRSMDKCY